MHIHDCLISVALFSSRWMEINIADPAILAKAVQKGSSDMATEAGFTADYGAILGSESATTGLPGWTNFRTPLDVAKDKGEAPKKRNFLQKFVLPKY